MKQHVVDNEAKKLEFRERLKNKVIKTVKSKSFIIWNVILLLVIILNVVSWNSTSFSDWYVNNIFMIINSVVSRITGLFPFSIGEIMIILGIILVFVVIIATMLLPLLRKKWKRFYSFIYRFFAWVLLFVCLIMTSNCFILYHTSTIEKSMYSDKNSEYDYEKLVTIYEHVVKELNELTNKFERDEKGHIIYDKDMMAVANDAMNALGDKFERLKGYYPKAKGIMNSDFMSQSYISGVYFPFSMEANYNTVMYIANYPAVICHEYAHLKGYIYEDEANFIGYIACIESEDDFFRYSGYLSVLYYIENDIFINMDYENDEEVIDRVFKANPLQQVYDDNVFLTEEVWVEVEEDSIVDTETADKITDTFTDTSLKLNGVEDGMASYARVVRLLFLYYDGILY